MHVVNWHGSLAVGTDLFKHLGQKLTYSYNWPLKAPPIKIVLNQCWDLTTGCNSELSKLYSLCKSDAIVVAIVVPEETTRIILVNQKHAAQPAQFLNENDYNEPVIFRESKP